jgi:hypothetical protein
MNKSSERRLNMKKNGDEPSLALLGGFGFVTIDWDRVL